MWFEVQFRRRLPPHDWESVLDPKMSAPKRFKHQKSARALKARLCYREFGWHLKDLRIVRFTFEVLS